MDNNFSESGLLCLLAIGLDLCGINRNLKHQTLISSDYLYIEKEFTNKTRSDIIFEFDQLRIIIEIKRIRANGLTDTTAFQIPEDYEEFYYSLKNLSVAELKNKSINKSVRNYYKKSVSVNEFMERTEDQLSEYMNEAAKNEKNEQIKKKTIGFTAIQVGSSFIVKKHNKSDY